MKSVLTSSTRISSAMLVATALLLGADKVSAQQSRLPPALKICATLDKCIEALGNLPARPDGSSEPYDQALAIKFSQFGEAAKHELLTRAASDDPRERNLVGAILMYWHPWFPADVPELRAGLRKDPGGWLARPLAGIGTPDAISALAEDLQKGEANQTDFSLSKLGVKAIPYLMPLLESSKTAAGAERVIADMDGKVVSFVPGWQATSLDTTKPTPQRLAALRAIAALGLRAKALSVALPQLLSDADPAIQSQAELTLRAVKNSAVARSVSSLCKPSAGRFDQFVNRSFACLLDIATFGPDGIEAGPDLLPFLASENDLERQFAITALGQIGYTPALPQLRQALSSTDWGIVYAAIRSIGWLGDQQSIPALKALAVSHWLPDVRVKATKVITALRSPQGRLNSRITFDRNRNDGGQPFEVDRNVLVHPQACKAAIWTWEGSEFRIPQFRGNTSSLKIGDGKLVGTDNGEWGGKLQWMPQNGDSVTLLDRNVQAVVQDGDQAIVIVGLAHLSLDDGAIISAAQTADAHWTLHEVMQLPAEASGLATLAPGKFAALSYGRAVVFTSHGVLGVAACAPSSRPAR